MPRPISYAVFCLKKKKTLNSVCVLRIANGVEPNICALFINHAFFVNAPATPVIYTLSLHDALPILGVEFDNGDMYVDGHKAASDVRDEFVSVTEKLMDELA